MGYIPGLRPSSKKQPLKSYGHSVDYGVFCPTPQKGIAQGLVGGMSLGVNEIAQRLNQYIPLKFLLFALQDADIAANSHLTRKVTF
jgi:hypothetical protein